MTPLRVNTASSSRAVEFDPGEELARDLVRAKLVADCSKRPVEVILDRQHVAGELRRCIGRRLLLLRFQPPAHVLHLGRRIERLVIRFGELLLKLGDLVVLLQLGQILRRFVAKVFGVVVQFSVVNHAINLVSALAVKSTMGTTRA